MTKHRRPEAETDCKQLISQKRTATAKTRATALYILIFAIGWQNCESCTQLP